VPGSWAQAGHGSQVDRGGRSAPEQPGLTRAWMVLRAGAPLGRCIREPGVRARCVAQPGDRQRVRAAPPSPRPSSRRRCPRAYATVLASTLCAVFWTAALGQAERRCHVLPSSQPCCRGAQASTRGAWLLRRRARRPRRAGGLGRGGGCVRAAAAGERRARRGRDLGTRMGAGIPGSGRRGAAGASLSRTLPKWRRRNSGAGVQQRRPGRAASGSWWRRWPWRRRRRSAAGATCGCGRRALRWRWRPARRCSGSATCPGGSARRAASSGGVTRRRRRARMARMQASSPLARGYRVG